MTSDLMTRDPIEFETDTLFQRIYNKWYAFSIVDDDCLIGEVSEVEIQKRLAKRTQRTQRV